MLLLSEIEGMSREEMVARLHEATADTVVLALFAYLPAGARIPNSNARLHQAFFALIPDAMPCFPQLTKMDFHEGMSFPYSLLLHRIRIRLDIMLTKEPDSEDLQLNAGVRSVILKEAESRFSEKERCELVRLAQSLAEKWSSKRRREN